MTSWPACAARTAPRSARGPARPSASVPRLAPSARYRRTPQVEFVLDLLQGAGIAAAIGIRPFLPVLLVGALASADLGLDFEGTSFAFLEEWPFLLGVLVLVSIVELARRRGESEPLVMALLGL